MNRTIQTTRNRMLTPSQLKTTMVLSIISLVINPLFGIGTALDSFFFDSQIEINNQRNTSAPKKNDLSFFGFQKLSRKNGFKNGFKKLINITYYRLFYH